MSVLETVIGTLLTQQLLPNSKDWWIRRVKSGMRYVNEVMTAAPFSSVSALLSAIEAGTVKEGDAVRVKCLPSHFGPLLVNPVLPITNGLAPGFRRGPQLAPQPGVHPLLSQVGDYNIFWQPIGLFPLIDGGIEQGYIYDAGAYASGVITQLPMAVPRPVMARLPALFRESHVGQFGAACSITGRVQRVDHASLDAAKYSTEDINAIRHYGSTWFFDATSEASEVIKIPAEKPEELWGSLHAQGHIAIVDGRIPQPDVVEALKQALTSFGHNPEVSFEQVHGGVTIRAEGVRICLPQKSLLYSVNADVDVINEYEQERHRFNALLARVLHGIRDVASASSATLSTDGDVDFTSTKADEAITVLRSHAAGLITDPTALALRDFYQQRAARAQDRKP